MANQSTPAAVIIASGLLIAWGTYSLVTMILAGASGTGGLFHVDFGFVGIPIGAGILSARQSSRMWAIFFAGLCLVTGAWMALKWAGSSFAVPSPLNIAVWAILMLGAAFVVWALCARRHREWFTTRVGTSAEIPARSFVWTTFVVATVLASLHFVTAKRLENAFAVHCRLIPVDAETSRQLQNMQWSCEALSHGGGKISSWSQAGDNGISVNLEGIAFTPLKVVVTSDDHEPGTIMIVPRLSGDQQVLLKPLQPASGSEKPVN